MMVTQIAPMLAVSDASAAIDFYKAAFGAELLWRLGSEPDIVAGLSIGGAPFFVAYEAPAYGTRGPASVGFTTVRIELFVDDPVAVHRQSFGVRRGRHSPVIEQVHDTKGPNPIKRLLQGAIVDSSGHMWLIGKILE